MAIIRSSSDPSADLVAEQSAKQARDLDKDIPESTKQRNLSDPVEPLSFGCFLERYFFVLQHGNDIRSKDLRQKLGKYTVQDDW